VFDLKGHPQATRAYAWTSPIEGSEKRRFFAVLHIPPVTSPLDAVRAAIVAEHRTVPTKEVRRFELGHYRAPSMLDYFKKVLQCGRLSNKIRIGIN
jgi:hypothetical protein